MDILDLLGKIMMALIIFIAAGMTVCYHEGHWLC